MLYLHNSAWDNLAYSTAMVAHSGILDEYFHRIVRKICQTLGRS